MSEGLHIAIIPARGGSKGVPRKNLYDLRGHPMMAYTIQAAVKSGVFASVVVSTEDAEIAEVAARYGAGVVDRPSELATDDAPTEPVMAHALAVEEERSGLRFDFVWLLQVTSPLRDAEDVRRAAVTLEETGADSVVSVVEDHAFLWSEYDRDGVALASPGYDPAHRPRRQDSSPALRETGALYAVRRSVWDDTQVRLGGRTVAVRIDPHHALDIDTMEDVKYAEWALAQRFRG